MIKLRKQEAELVSAVIPAYNSAGTIGETLESVRGQSHRQIEIVVVNDGSTDATRQIAERHAAEDDRIRIVDIANSGVAAARNAGAAVARSDLIAPVDADDLWHPDKLARQLAVMRSGGPSMGFVYTGFRRIDMQSRCIGNGSFGGCEGWVFLQAILGNFVGNGSSLLIRRAAFERAGGYSSELRSHGLQGTEDWLLQILIARNWRVGAVPGCMTGYRQRPGAMSSDLPRMLRSRLLSYDIVERIHPDVPDWVMATARASCGVQLAWSLAVQGRLADAASSLVDAIRQSAPAALKEMGQQAANFGVRQRKRIAGRLGIPGGGAPGLLGPFLEADPEACIQRRRLGSLVRAMECAAEADRAIGHASGGNAARLAHSGDGPPVPGNGVRDGA